MSIPIEITGVVQGNTIVLDEQSFLPEGYHVKLHLILTPEEGLRLGAGSWADMTPEEIADFEQFMTQMEGRPFHMPGSGSE